MPIKKLSDGTEYVKAVYWEGEVMKGTWAVTRKIDGVRVLRNSAGQYVSRNNKPLYNLDHLEISDAEIFNTDWNTSVSMVRTQNGPPVSAEHVYELANMSMDQRLALCIVTDPTTAQIKRMLQVQLDLGYEGLVMRQGKRWKKVVPKLYADVRITGWYLGKTGRNIGKLGGFETAHGNIGGGFMQAFRDSDHSVFDSWVGKIIEVGYRETTKNGKLRFASFVRERFDKDEESV